MIIQQEGFFSVIKDKYFSGFQNPISIERIKVVLFGMIT